MKELLAKLIQLVELKKSLSDSEKKTIRRAFKQFDDQGNDPYAHHMSPQKGVSQAGIEARRGDIREPGVISHGYARSTTPEKHISAAKKLHQHLINHLKGVKPNLPKVEKGIGPRMVSDPMIINNPIKTTEPKVSNTPIYVGSKDKKK